jgi:outer membrane receptor for ferrienterochelin and colicins
MYFLFVDINHNVQGNENLQAENSHNFIASLDYRHTINKNIAAQFKLSSFYNSINNQIQLSLVDPNTTMYQYINIGEMTSSGANISSEFFIYDATFNWNSSFIQNHARVNVDGGLNEWRVFQHTLNIQYPIKNYNTNVLWFSRFSGKTQGFTSNGEIYSLPSFTLADLSFSHNLFNKAQFQWGAKNIFNVNQLVATAQTGGVHNNSNGGVNIGMGRILFIQLTVNL